MIQTNTTTVRSVLLAILMVCSAVAFAVPATAAVTSSERTVSDTTIAPGEQATVTVTSQLDSEGTGYSFEESFSGSVAGAEITSVTTGGSDASTIIESASSNGLVITFASQDLADTEIEIQYTITANSSTGTIAITDGESSSAAAGTTEITVEEDPLTVTQSAPTTEVSAGDSTTITTTIDNPRPNVSLAQSFQPTVAAANITDVSRRSGDSTVAVDPLVAAADADGSTVTVNGLDLSDTLTVETELTIPENANADTQYNISSNVTSGSAAQATTTTQLTVVGSPAERYAGEDGSVNISDLGTAASDYATGELSISELASVAAAYAQ